MCYVLKKELGESIDDDYSWIRFKYYIDCMIEEAEKASKNDDTSLKDLKSNKG